MKLVPVLSFPVESSDPRAFSAILAVLQVAPPPARNGMELEWNAKETCRMLGRLRRPLGRPRPQLLPQGLPCGFALLFFSFQCFVLNDLFFMVKKYLSIWSLRIFFFLLYRFALELVFWDCVQPDHKILGFFYGFSKVSQAFFRKKFFRNTPSVTILPKQIRFRSVRTS